LKGLSVLRGNSPGAFLGERVRATSSSYPIKRLKPGPLTIVLKRAVEDVQVPVLRLKIDPGSKKTGLAIVN
jgi:tRNA A37 threonylcarbamoyladenosine synthetase subunit TsaC/SUA5/YrdC